MVYRAERKAPKSFIRRIAHLGIGFGTALITLLGSVYVDGTAQAQAIAATPRVLHESIRPIALSNGFVNIRDRLERAREVAARGGIAPLDVQARWRAALHARIDRLEDRSATALSGGGSDAWEDAVRRVRAASDPIREAQRFVHHAIAYRSDRQGRDHWQTPLETLARGAGDCEDHAILKRALLLEAGLSSSRVSLVFLRTARGEGHVIVQVNTSNGPRILDNRTTAQRIGRLLPGDEVVAVYGGGAGVEIARR